MKRTIKINRNDPNFFPSLLSFKCVPIELKCIAYQLYSFTYDTKHGQQYTKTWLHEKGMFSIRIGHNKIYVWTHDTYTKVLGCKTWNNTPPMYTSIMKLPLIWLKQVLWPLYKSYDLSTHFIKNSSISTHHLILNNIFLDKSYDLSTYLIKCLLIK